jgi:glycine oxidase ThiO
MVLNTDFSFAMPGHSTDNSSMETPDVLIIGAGVIGCSLARELARANLTVTVVERSHVGAGASSAAAGLLVPALSSMPAGPLVDLCHQSAALYESWIHELREDGAGDVGYRRPGVLEVWQEPQPQALQPRSGDPVHPSRRIEVLSEEEVRRREPALASSVFGAIFYPEDAQVDPARLTRAVAQVAELTGVTIRQNEPVQQLVQAGERITVVHTTGGLYHPGAVVLTAGAWSGGLAESLGLALPTQPVKGQMVQADCRVSPIHTPLAVGDALFVPRPDGSLVLGVTVEEAGFDDRVTLGGLRQILHQVCAVAPAVGRLPLARAWAGLRPATPDGWPYMGPVPPLQNLWVSTGHFRKGILLAPLCAQLMARSILANHLDDDLQPFKPTRRPAG